MTTADQTEPRAGALPPQYVPGEVESRRYQGWVQAGYFTADASSQAPSYTIMIPPPNVTGSLHIGHALDHTLIDALVRRRRMQGYNALWLPGMDHAGIATQNVVERELAKDGLSRHDLGREAFVERVWQWKAEYGGKILGQMRRLGDSVDWSRERFTMDDGLSRAVQTIFKRLFDDELIYRAQRIINWCPRCMTALSDIEVDHSDDDGELVSIRYGEGPTDSGGLRGVGPPGYSVVVATTRVETMLGDTAVAVHPDDPRYAHLVGQTVELPLTGRRIPIVADSHVDPEFGTGAVKVTPAHDPDDFEIGRRHGLPSLTIMDERGVITASGPFEGLDRFEARPAVLSALREQGRVIAEKRPYVHAVGHCGRCGTTVEPRLSLQWFVKVGPLAKAAGDAVRDGRVRIYPGQLAARYFDWVDDMHDWCISRQLWWGHRIPVWYGPDGEVRCVGPDEAPPAGPGWSQDADVLDTWFSSALWPFSTLGWPDDTADLRAFYPTSVLVTGYDILFFWVARMMLFGLYAMADAGPEESVPFRKVSLHGLVRDQFGKKMSKSRGNTVDPLDWIARFGADATRFTLARGASPGGDVALSEEWVTGSRNFCNKLWNAVRFALLARGGDPPEPPEGRGAGLARGGDPPEPPEGRGAGLARGGDPPEPPEGRGAGLARGGDPPEPPEGRGASGRRLPSSQLRSSVQAAPRPGGPTEGSDLSMPDRWILSRLGTVIGQADALFDAFEFAKVSELLYHFAWDEVCDWYLELAKFTLNGGDQAAADRTRRVLGHVLDQLLRLIHPLMPFVTEELWTALTGGESVMIAAWPSGRVTDEIPAAAPLADPVAEAEIESLMRLVTAVRRFRADQGLRPTQSVPAVLSGIERTSLAGHEGSIRSLLRLTEPVDGVSFQPNASVEAESIVVEIDASSGIDVAAERRRMDKELAAAAADADLHRRKLANPAFVDKAPEAVVAKSRDRLAVAEAEIVRLTERLASLTDATAAATP